MEYNFAEHVAAIVITVILIETAIVAFDCARVRVGSSRGYDRIAVAASFSSSRSVLKSFVVWQLSVIGTFLVLFGTAPA